MAPRETENNAYATLWDHKKNLMVCYGIFESGQFEPWFSCHRKRLKLTYQRSDSIGLTDIEVAIVGLQRRTCLTGRG